jgi:hypothetical protein
MARLQPRGERAWNARLPDAEAAAARLRFEAGEATIKALAVQYSCCYKTMWRAVNQVTYWTNDCPNGPQ